MTRKTKQWNGVHSARAARAVSLRLGLIDTQGAANPSAAVLAFIGDAMPTSGYHPIAPG
jgi:hypothetical protein